MGTRVILRFSVKESTSSASTYKTHRGDVTHAEICPNANQTFARTMLGDEDDEDGVLLYFWANDSQRSDIVDAEASH